jgi:hypothetical protein
VLSGAAEAVATADGAILDRCAGWVNLARAVVEAHVPSAFVVDLGVAAATLPGETRSPSGSG